MKLHWYLIAGVGLLTVLLSAGMGRPTLAADFNGDGTGDIAIVRPGTGLWAVRGVTRLYFGISGDDPVPGDYNGNGIDKPAIFRAASGLWAVRDVTRAYFGAFNDQPKPGDYNGDGTADIGIFRQWCGLWAVRGVTRVYFGKSADLAIEAGKVRAPIRTLDGFSTAQEAGYYEAFDLAAAQPALSSANIRRGVVIFGVAGNPNVVNTSSGNAAAGDVRAGKKAWVDGAEVTGTIATRTLSAGSETVEAGYYAATTLSAVDGDLAAGNIKSGVTIFGKVGTVVKATGDAAVEQVLAGATFSKAGEAGLTGTMTNVGQQDIMPGTTVQPITRGYHNGTGEVAGDADLVTANIRSGVTIFGVAGKTEVVDTSTGDAAAGEILAGKKAWVDGSEITGTMPAGRLLRTGQTTSYLTGDDGTYQTGTAFSYQTLDPAGNGEIVTIDNVTGLMWASVGDGAGCNWGTDTDWAAAIDWAEGLSFANQADWRLPNRRELESIVDFGQYDPAINTTYFPNTVPNFYWSGSTNEGFVHNAWAVDFNYGYVIDAVKSNCFWVRAVRGGE
ncbi:MAG: DUF1566 domain-containing protein [PVC group bacterium]